jgi:hypothetical protein
MSRDNPLWGTERIRGELLKLGIEVSNRSIRRYRWRTPRPLGTHTWRTFLLNELKGIWAADLCTVQTLGCHVQMHDFPPSMGDEEEHIEGVE